MNDVPNSERRVIDGETVNSEHQQTQKDKGNATQLNSRVSSTDWLARLLGGVAIGGVLWLMSHQSDLTPLIEDQNQLNQRIQQLEAQASQPQQQQLKQQLTSLEQTVNALSTEVDVLNEKVLNPANEPVVTKGEVEQLQKQLAALQGQLKSWVDRWQQALQELSVPKSQGEDASDASDTDALQDLRTQLTQMGKQLGQLFGQIAQQGQEASSQSSSLADAMNLQRWLLHTNAQWLLTGNVQQTQTRLHAIEKAVQLSDLSDQSKIALLRAIGQDLAYLESFSKFVPDADLGFKDLRAWIEQLSPSTLETHSSMPQSGEDFMTRLKGLVEIRKRDEGPTAADRLLQFDLVKQRALLLVDQLVWAYQTHHEQLYTQTRQQLQALFKRYLPAQQAALQQQLEKLPALQQPQPLKSAEAL
jgi:predicted  nucleic acid-binding Zn-ribbon protein